MAGQRQMAEPWLDEGISEFAAAYFYGSFHAYSSSKPVNSSVYAFPNLPAPTTSDDPGSYTQTIYYKSAAFLNGLRSRMGSTAFFAGLRDLFNANRNGTMTTREFYDAMAGRGAGRRTCASSSPYSGRSNPGQILTGGHRGRLQVRSSGQLFTRWEFG
jgi:hypothetical protein